MSHICLEAVQGLISVTRLRSQYHRGSARNERPIKITSGSNFLFFFGSRVGRCVQVFLGPIWLPPNDGKLLAFLFVFDVYLPNLRYFYPLSLKFCTRINTRIFLSIRYRLQLRVSAYLGVQSTCGMCNNNVGGTLTSYENSPNFSLVQVPANSSWYFNTKNSSPADSRPRELSA